jgi:hypothetical protein
MTVSLAVDILIAGLLVATIAYAWMLNRKLALLRADRAALDQTSLRFTEAASRAEQAVSDLKGASSTSGRALEDTLKRATALRDDLSYLVERAEAAAGKLEAARQPSAPPEPTPVAASAPAKEARPRRGRKAEPAASKTDNPAQTLQELKQALANLR